MVSLNGRLSDLVWSWVFFGLFLFCFAVRFINVVYQSLTVCCLKGGDLGGVLFPYFAEISAERFKTHQTKLPHPTPISQNNRKSAENQIHAIHSGFLKV